MSGADRSWLAVPRTITSDLSALSSRWLTRYQSRTASVRFDTTNNSTDETYLLYAARLRNLLLYYLASKGVGEDFDKLCDLIISDSLKGCLPHGPLNDVLCLEGYDWFTPYRVAYLADTFLSHRSAASSAKAGMGGSTRMAAATAADGVSSQHKGGFGQQKKGTMPT